MLGIVVGMVTDLVLIQPPDEMSDRDKIEFLIAGVQKLLQEKAELVKLKKDTEDDIWEAGKELEKALLKIDDANRHVKACRNRLENAAKINVAHTLYGGVSD